MSALDRAGAGARLHDRLKRYSHDFAMMQGQKAASIGHGDAFGKALCHHV